MDNDSPSVGNIEQHDTVQLDGGGGDKMLDYIIPLLIIIVLWSIWHIYEIICMFNYLSCI